MNEKQHQDFLQKVVDIFQGNYAAPTKALVWAKTVKEWGGIIVSTILLAIASLWIVGIFLAHKDTVELSKKVSSVYEDPVPSLEPGSPYNQERAVREVVPHVKDLLKFVTLVTNSINKRQEILENLLVLSDVFHNDSQEALEKKLSALSTLSRQCTTEKGKFVSNMAKGPNPFEIEIADAVRELIGESYRSLGDGIAIEPRQETTHWNQLCTLCQKEVSRANELLLQKIGSTSLEPKH